MIFTLTLNPSIDYIISMDKFQIGRVNRTTQEIIYPGGKGINVSLMLGNLGIKSVALGIIAGFTGEKIESMLVERNVCTDFIRAKSGMSRINVKITTSPETEINGQGPSVSIEDIEKLFKKLAQLQRGDILVLAGSVPGSMPQTIYSDIMEILSGRGVEVVVDTHGKALSEVLRLKPFLIKPNIFELGDLFGVKFEEEQVDSIHNWDLPIMYAKKLQTLGARNVLVSLGAKGAFFVSEKETVYRCSAPVGVAVNAVGAGDSMVAGFLAGYLMKQEAFTSNEKKEDLFSEEMYENALMWGVCSGSASAFSKGLATKSEVLDLIMQPKGFKCENER